VADSKKFQNVDILKEIAATLPTQRPPEPARVDVRPVPIVELPRPVPAATDPQVQISFSARFSTRKGMFQVARDLDVTLKAFILDALRDKYPQLGITDDDLADMRTRRR